METMDSYGAVEQMIFRGEYLLSDVERLLDTLHKQQRISASEHETLLELAWNKSIPGEHLA